MFLLFGTNTYILCEEVGAGWEVLLYKTNRKWKNPMVEDIE